MSKEQIANLEWVLREILSKSSNKKIKSIEITWENLETVVQSNHTTYCVVPNIKTEYYE